MHSYLFLILLLLNFKVFSMDFIDTDKSKNSDPISNLIQKEFKKACQSKKSLLFKNSKKSEDSASICNWSFLSSKIRVEKSDSKDHEVLETHIKFNRKYMGKLKNNLEDLNTQKDCQLRRYFLTLYELSRISGQNFGSVELGSSTTCGPIKWYAGGHKGEITCKTFLNKR